MKFVQTLMISIFNRCRLRRGVVGVRRPRREKQTRKYENRRDVNRAFFCTDVRTVSSRPRVHLSRYDELYINYYYHRANPDTYAHVRTTVVIRQKIVVVLYIDASARLERPFGNRPCRSDPSPTVYAILSFSFVRANNVFFFV